MITPIVAGVDFDDSSIEMTIFERGDHLISIPITPDTINEAVQVFAVQLSVLGNISDANMDADFSLCVVVDDDRESVSKATPNNFPVSCPPPSTYI